MLYEPTLDSTSQPETCPSKPTKYRVIYDNRCTVANLKDHLDEDREVKHISDIVDIQTLTLRLCYLSQDILKGGEGDCGGLGVTRYPAHLIYCDKLRTYHTYSTEMTKTIAIKKTAALALQIAALRAKQTAAL